MPAKDFYHDTVVQALTKAGWIVKQNQARFKLGSRPIFIDIFALRFSDNAPIYVEVKGFEETASVSSLGAAIGQYSLYKAVLRALNNHAPLYLAVPLPAFNGIFKEAIGRLAIEEFGIQLIGFDAVLMEIVTWVT